MACPLLCAAIADQGVLVISGVNQDAAADFATPDVLQVASTDGIEYGLSQREVNSNKSFIEHVAP